MKNISSEVEEVEDVNEVEEVKDQESRDLSFRGGRMFGAGPSRREQRMCWEGLGFSFTSCISFTSFTSLAFTGVYS